MKSKKAINHLEIIKCSPKSQVAQKADFVIVDRNIYKLIEIAESELLETHVSKEKVVEAFRQSCSSNDKGKCNSLSNYDYAKDEVGHPVPCFCIKDCYKLEWFIEELNEKNNN